MPYKDAARRAESQRTRNLKWRTNNKEQMAAIKRRWNARNKDKCRKYSLAYAKRHPAACVEAGARYRARKYKAMPSWLTREQKRAIRETYAKASRLRLTVDHIVPLKGRTVCGLHVPWNLQLLAHCDNARKHNHLLE